MQFIVDEKVKNLGVNAIGVIIEDIDNKTITSEFEKYRENEIKKLLNKYKDLDINEDIILKGFYELHDKVNVGRRKNVPASENLISHLLKNDSMYSINKAVDVYNIISMDSKLALGAHDINNIIGNVNLRLTDGTELFVPLGQDEPKQVKQGEYSYIDDSNEIICRLEIRQVNKTKVTEDSKNIFYIVQGNEHTSMEYVKETAQRLIDETVRFCGGKGHIL